MSGRFHIPCFCLIATLALACSFDASKLRASASPRMDGATDDLVEPDTAVARAGLDGPAAIPDLPMVIGDDALGDMVFSPDFVGMNDVVARDDIALSRDAFSVGDMVGPGDSPSGDGGSGGAGIGSGGAGSSGSGGVVGTGGINGTGGTASGGVVGTGGINGTGGTASGGVVGTGGINGTGGAGVDPDLVLWYAFDESSGTTAADSAVFGGVARNATLTTLGTGGSATFSTASQVGTHAVSLTPSTIASYANGGYVTVPSLQTLAPGALTISVWVKPAANTASQNWDRVFDFGTGEQSYMLLTTRAADVPTAQVRFAITTKGMAATSEQRLNGPATLSPNVWHHLAVVLAAGAPYTGRLYIDGVSVATNNAMTLHAADLGATTNNWLGRPQFGSAAANNPLFNGMLDDFRAYKRALTDAEIAALFAGR